MSTFEERYVADAEASLEASRDLLSQGSYRGAAWAAGDASETLSELAALITTRAAQERKEAKP